MTVLSRIIMLVVAGSSPALAQSVTAGNLKLEGIVAFTEGPAWHPSGNVYFTDIANNRIMRRDPKGTPASLLTISSSPKFAFRLEGLTANKKIRRNRYIF